MNIHQEPKEVCQNICKTGNPIDEILNVFQGEITRIEDTLAKNKNLKNIAE